jgi:hypothetical protein
VTSTSIGTYRETAGLGPRPRTELHDVARGQIADQLRRCGGQQAILDPRRVVLRHLGDLLEQSGPDGIVEVFRRQCLGALGEAPSHVAQELVKAISLVEMDVNLIAHDCSPVDAVTLPMDRV